MKCPHKECANSSDCAIIDITKKIPDNFNACSYSKTSVQLEKMLKKKSTIIDPKEIKRAKREAKRQLKESNNE